MRCSQRKRGKLESISFLHFCVCVRFDYYANRVRKVATDYSNELLFNIGDKSDFSYILEVKR